MFEKRTCERCGKEYRMRTISENRGKHLCSDCVKTCSNCGKKLPASNWFGQTGSVTGAFLGPVAGSLRDSRRPAIGSGMCNECFWKTQEQKGNAGIDDLAKLAELRDKGIITEEEFQAKKKQILGL